MQEMREQVRGVAGRPVVTCYEQVWLTDMAAVVRDSCDSSRPVNILSRFMGLRSSPLFLPTTELNILTAVENEPQNPYHINLTVTLLINALNVLSDSTK